MSREISNRNAMASAEQEAQKVFRREEPLKAMIEHDRAKKAFYDNRDRLKAERLAREAAKKNGQ